MTYKEDIIKSMKLLSEDERVIFLGQNIKYGSHIYNTLNTIADEKLYEMPIAEDMQMGISIGLALEGYAPVTVYERMDFLIIALNQLINHLDKIEQMSRGEFKPVVIIRTIVGTKKPLYPGPQHSQNHTKLLLDGLTNVDVVELDLNKDIVEEYKRALKSDKSTILIELRELYDE